MLGGGIPAKLTMEMKDASGETSRIAIGLESQQTTGMYDPSLKTASNFVSSFTGYTTETQTKAGVQVSRIAKLVVRSEWAPSSPGRVTVQGDSQLEGYSTITPVPGVGEVKVTMGRLGGSTRIENFDVDGLGTLLRTAFELGSSAKATGKATGKAATDAKGASTPEQKASALKLVGLVFSMLDAMETDYSYEDIKVEGGALFSGSLRRFGTNFTLGLLGTRDVATEMGMEVPRNDIGLALCRHGVPDGPYVVLPIVGPRTLRDAIADIVVTNAIIYVALIPVFGPVPGLMTLLVIEALDEAAALAVARQIDSAQERGGTYDDVRERYVAGRALRCGGA